MKHIIIMVLLTVAMAAAATADPRQWGSEGIPIRQGHYIEHMASATNDEGYTLVVWSDMRTGWRNIYAQLVSPDGVLQWDSGGVAVAPRSAFQNDPVAVPVSDGWIVVWADYRDDLNRNECYFGGDVWAQKLTFGGERLWGGDLTGVRVDAQEASLLSLEEALWAFPDGSDGAVISWGDFGPGSSYRFLVQRIDAWGRRAWAEDVLVFDERISWWSAKAAADCTGGVFVAWATRGSGGDPADIRAARVTSDGTLPWGETGILVCSAPFLQHSPAICPDGSGGAYVVWCDGRIRACDLFAQRVNAVGQALWIENGVPLSVGGPWRCEASLSLSRIGINPDGLLVVWRDFRVNAHIAEVFAQKLAPDGSPLWEENGLRVCGDASPDPENPGQDRRNPRCVSDNAGGLVCAWSDSRNYAHGWEACDVFAARVLADGTLIWADSCGRPVSAYPDQHHPRSLTANSTSVSVLYGSPGRLLWQALNLNNGERMHGPDGVLLASGLSSSVEGFNALPLDAGRFAAVWEANLNARTSLFYQIMDTAGHGLHQRHGIPLVADSAFPATNSTALCLDGTGGFFVAFVDRRTGTGRVRTVRVNAAGQVATNPQGEIVYDREQEEDTGKPFCVPDGGGGCLVAWVRFDVSSYSDIYVSRVGADCRPLWTQPALLMQTPEDNFIAGMVPALDGGCLVVWIESSWPEYYLWASGVSATGTVQWTIPVAMHEIRMSDCAVAADGEGGALIAWCHDTGSGFYQEVLVQRVSPHGVLLWESPGVWLSQPNVWGYRPALLPASDGTFYAAWNEYREGNSTTRAQRLSEGGGLLWPAGGVLLNRNTAGGRPGLAADDEGGLFAVWLANRGWTQQIHATHLTPDGIPVNDPYWIPETGGAVSDSFAMSEEPAVTADGSGGFFVVWASARLSGLCNQAVCDLYAQRICDITSGVGPRAPVLPGNYVLCQNAPNPFNPRTEIRFTLALPARTVLKVFDILGREVAQPLDRTLPAGEHRVIWDAHALPTGVYFYRLESGAFRATRKMVLLK